MTQPRSSGESPPGHGVEDATSRERVCRSSTISRRIYDRIHPALSLKRSTFVVCALAFSLWVWASVCSTSFGNGNTYHCLMHGGELWLRWAPRGTEDSGIFPVASVAFDPSWPQFRGFDRISMGAHPMIWDVRFPLWMLTIAVGMVTTAVWMWDSAVVRPLRRQERGLCPRCGYDLRLNVSGRCPECGRGLDLPTRFRRSDVDLARAGAGHLALAYAIPLGAFLMLWLVGPMPVLGSAWTLSYRVNLFFIQAMGPAAWLILIPFGMVGATCAFSCCVALFGLWFVFARRTWLCRVPWVVHCAACIAWCLSGCLPVGCLIE